MAALPKAAAWGTGLGLSPCRRGELSRRQTRVRRASPPWAAPTYHQPHAILEWRGHLRGRRHLRGAGSPLAEEQLGLHKERPGLRPVRHKRRDGPGPNSRPAGYWAALTTPANGASMRSGCLFTSASTGELGHMEQPEFDVWDWLAGTVGSVVLDAPAEAAGVALGVIGARAAPRTHRR